MPFRDGTEPGQQGAQPTFRSQASPSGQMTTTDLILGKKPPLKADQGLGFEWGAMHPLDNAAIWLEDAVRAIPGGKTVDDALNQFGSAIGLQPSAYAAAQQHQQQIQAAAAQGRRPGIIGQIAGNTVSTIPLMAVTKNPWIGGALSGAVSTKNPHNLAGVATDAAIGAVAGKAGDMIGQGVSKALSPQVRAPAKALLDEGVQLTPGQITGGMLKTVEDASTHLPVLGTLVKNAQGQSIRTFNRAMLNRSLAPIGEQLPANLTAGREAVDYAAQRLGQAFENARPMAPVALDQPFAAQLAHANQAIGVLPAARQQQVRSILGSFIRDRLDPATGAIAPDAVQLIDRELGQTATRYGGSLGADEQVIGNILGDVQNGFRDMVARQDPGYAKAIAAAREGWANFVRVRTAAASAGAKEGVFTAAQLSQAVRAGDKTVGKSAFARGQALAQQLSDAGQQVLPSTVNDSGTATRGLIDMAALGAMGMGAHAAPHIAPAAIAPVAAMAGLYTKPGLAASRWALAGSRPAWAVVAGKLLQKGAPAYGAMGGSTARALLNYLGNPEAATP